MRLLLLLAALVALPAAAQSGMGVISGLVLPEDTSYGGGAGGWEREGPADDAYAVGPVLTLTPIRAHRGAQKRAIRAHGSYGRYTFGRTPMGLYHLRVDAPGYRPWEAEVYLPSDGQLNLFVLLRRKG